MGKSGGCALFPGGALFSKRFRQNKELSRYFRFSLICSRRTGTALRSQLNRLYFLFGLLFGWLYFFWHRSQRGFYLPDLWWTFNRKYCKLNILILKISTNVVFMIFINKKKIGWQPAVTCFCLLPLLLAEKKLKKQRSWRKNIRMAVCKNTLH